MTSLVNAEASAALQSREAYFEAGKRLRAQVPRESHADYTVTERRDPVAILAETDRTRIASLLPIRHERMSESVFAFLRGAAAVMATDLAGVPRAGISVQACGDCHLMNFGAFDTPEGKVIFDINDFDETHPGVDFTVDIKRLVASVAVAAQDAGFSDKKARAIAQATAKAYREFVADLAEMSPLEVWHTSLDVDRELKRIDDPKLVAKIADTLQKAERNLAKDGNFPHLATTEGGATHIADRPPLIYHLDETADAHARAALAAYHGALRPDVRLLVDRYALADVAFKVVGVGSVGTFCAIGLYMTADGEPLFLQIKEAQASVLERLGTLAPFAGQQGERVVEGQRIMQAASDLFLGWCEDQSAGRFFYVRHLKNPRIGSIGELIEGSALPAYAPLCGRSLARAHARSGDVAVLAGYMGKADVFDDALASFAMLYAEQTKRDHARLVASQHSKSKATRRAS